MERGDDLVRRSDNFDYIEEKLNHLSCRIRMRGKLNVLNLNIHAETFFANFINILFGFDMKNMNMKEQNIEAIDLIDENLKIIAQVSATCTKPKIEKSLHSEMLNSYQGYRFIFISIVEDATNLRKATFCNNPYGVSFNPKEDIVDIKLILNEFLNKNTDEQDKICEFIEKELELDHNKVAYESNLAALINILSDVNLGEVIDSPEINAFQIENKITFNDLENVRFDIDDYKIYHHTLDEIYSSFDKEGANKSRTVLQIIRKQYTKHIINEDNSCNIFYLIIEEITRIIKHSKNYVEIPLEELDFCVHILVVDAFIRCRIFKNPKGYSHVIT